mmetsp:Transcript_32768/g.55247  ORF Transcript_32768/g.55247 Transcript_32768/m.55247 type:complete len:108 (+) Transcript_32768:211-534(+)
MSKKHAREEESFDDGNLRNSIKKLKLEQNDPYSSIEVSSLSSNDFQDSSVVESEGTFYESNLMRMNKLLNTLHCLRMGRIAQRNANLPQPSGYTISTSEAAMDVSHD